MSRHADCKICGLLSSAAPEDIVLDGPNWAVVAMQDAPGVFMAFTADHDAGIASLPSETAAEMGPLFQTLSASLVATTEFEKVSVIYLGDNSIHTHFMLLGRSPGDAPVFDNTPLLARFANKDQRRSRSLAGRLREDLNATGIGS